MMSRVHRAIVKVHRVAAGLLLLAIVPAAYASFRGQADSPLVYLPLPFLFALILTGTYQLVAPWVRRAQAGKGAAP